MRDRLMVGCNALNVENLGSNPSPAAMKKEAEQKLVDYLERMNFQDWANQQMNTWTLIRVNVIAGIARGLGMAIGASFIFAIVVAIVGTVKKFVLQ
jgi:Domain of unknown function (DUF5665)